MDLNGTSLSSYFLDGDYLIRGSYLLSINQLYIAFYKTQESKE